MELLHNHYSDGGFYPGCPRCKLNNAAPEMYEFIVRLQKELHHTIDTTWPKEWHELNTIAVNLIAKIEGK